MTLKSELNQIYKKAVVRQREEQSKAEKERKIVLKKRKVSALENLDKHCNEIIRQLTNMANNGDRFGVIKFHSDEDQFYIVDEILAYIKSKGLSGKKELTQMAVHKNLGACVNIKEAWSLYFEW